MSPTQSILSILCLMPLLALSTPLLSDHEYASHFADWMTNYNVAYESSALSSKFQTFKHNHAFIARHNEEAAAGRHTYTLKLNSYGDLTNAEYRTLLGYVSENATGLRGTRPQDLQSLHRRDRHSSTGDSCPSVSSSSTGAPRPPPVFPPSSTAGPAPPTPQQSSSARPPVVRASSTAGPAPPSGSTGGPAPTNGGIDWRGSGFVGPIEDQGQCGSCWSFASTATMAGAWAQKTGTLYQFSEQQLLDCVNGGRSTCNTGGSMYDSYNYFISTSAAQKYPQTDASYPYTAQSGGGCRYAAGSAQTDVRFTSYQRITSESALASASNTVAAIAVAIDASTQAFQFYDRGVLTDTSCGSSSSSLNHAVTVVGYGSTGGTDYWIVKNSWGASWGDNGYVLMRRNYNNMCGVATDASYLIA